MSMTKNWVWRVELIKVHLHIKFQMVTRFELSLDNVSQDTRSDKLSFRIITVASRVVTRFFQDVIVDENFNASDQDSTYALILTRSTFWTKFHQILRPDLLTKFLDTYIVKINILTMFHQDWLTNMASRLVTK
ncbi:hypothetical protein DPMN_183461 [Dreissena polymorpha]|uniref:Uncharacterized protein n=1 Tax=Dreissena polymorpha TaxID=45954 RepID=A0A9D4DJ10_DREPO|nr:hypothetical protein DPMN_183461 [Dreissena polymorpha]